MYAEPALAPPEAAPEPGAETVQRTLSASDGQMADFHAFKALLVEWNQTMNLVGPSALSAFWGRHVYDSAQLLALAPGALTWADLGAGAGFPGIVLAILLKGRAGARVHLVESMAKKCRFLAAVTQELGLPASVHHARAESLSMTVDIVTARACAPLPRLLEFAWPYVQKGATGLFLKGQDVDAEVVRATRYWDFKADLIASRSDPNGRILKLRTLAHAKR